MTPCALCAHVATACSHHSHSSIGSAAHPADPEAHPEEPTEHPESTRSLLVLMVDIASLLFLSMTIWRWREVGEGGGGG